MYSSCCSFNLKYKREKGVIIYKHRQLDKHFANHFEFEEHTKAYPHPANFDDVRLVINFIVGDQYIVIYLAVYI